MTTFLIAAITADGFIAKNAHHVPSWTSKEDKKFFVEKTKEAGVVIMGLNTYKTIGKPLPGRLNIVYSKTEKDLEGVEVTQDKPFKLLNNLSERGYKEVAITGGAQIYTMFMEADLVDKVYLTVEPILFGNGMSLFTKYLDIKLRLQSTQKLNDNTVAFEYSVVRDRLL